MSDEVTAQEVPESDEHQAEDNEGGKTSFREKLEKAYDELAQRDSKKASGEEDEEGEGDSDEKKLPSPDQDPKEKSEEEVESKDKPDGKKEQTEKKEAEKPEVKPPVSWSRKDREIFKTLDSSAQEVIARRELERDKALQRATTERAKIEKATQPYSELIDSVSDVARSTKQKPVAFLNTLVSADKQARENPVQFLTNFAKNYDIDLKTLVEGDVDSAFDSEMHNVSRLLQQQSSEIERLKQEYQALKESSAQQADKSALGPSAQVVVEFFKGDRLESLEKDPDLLDRVITEATIARKRDQGASASEILEEAYDNAVMASPHLRQAYLSKKAHAKQEAAKREVQDARSKAGIKSSAPGARAPQRFASTRKLLEHHYDRLARR